MSLRILWSSNSLWVATGYGIQAKHVIPGLRRYGHEVAQFAWYGLEGAMIQAGDVPIYPRAYDQWGNDIIGAHVAHFKADLVISLQDIWVLPEDYRERCGVAWAPWFPIDQAPIPPRVLERAKQADYPITYSLFGTEEARKAGLDVTYIPHGVNTKVFQPIDDATRREIRQRLGWPEDAFVVTMVAANKGLPSRKGFPEAFRIFQAFHSRHPDAYLYLHTENTTARAGVDFDELIQSIPGFPADRIQFVDQYLRVIGLPEQYLADVYGAADVHLQPSYAEGFGIPIIEAQACGTPVLVNGCTSMPELCFAGQVVEPVQEVWTPLGGWVGIPSIDGFVEALEWAYQHRGDESVRAQARAGALAYDWDVVIDEYWIPFLQRVEYEIKGAQKAA